MFFYIFRFYMKIFNLPMIEMIMNIFMIFSICIVLIYRRYYSKQELLISVTLLTIGIILKNLTIILLVLLLISSKYSSLDKIMKITFLTHLMLFLGVILVWSLIPELSQTEKVYYKIIEGISIVRKDLGFGNPNTALKHFLPILISYVWLSRKNFNIKKSLLIISVLIFLYKLTYSRTVTFICILFIFLLLILKNCKFKKIYTSILINISKVYMELMIILSLLSAYFFNSNIFLNNLLSGRPFLWNYYLISYKITLLPLTSIPYKVLKEFPLDNSYLSIIFNQGIIVLTIIILIQKKVIKKLIESKDYFSILLILMVNTISFFESYYISLAFNPLLLMIYYEK